MKDRACPPALGKGRHHSRISPGQQEGASLAAKPCFSTWTQAALVENSHFYTAAFQSTHILGKNTKILPNSLFQNNNTPGFYNPPGQQPDLFTQPVWQALKSKIPPQPLPLPKGEFPQAAPHTCGVTRLAFTVKAKINH